MTAEELRKSFIDFFKSKDHVIVKSSSLIPENDPTLLFTTAGMVQFKQYYSRIVEPPFKRAATIQKCLRAGGKGSDLENVGKTPRHHTFFEMLGNFSFGDYFKKEAIEWAFEYITKVVKIPVEKLWVSVYKDDEEAADIWKNCTDIPKERIVYLGKKDNWWGPAGAEGACGPCSEIYIDLRDIIEYPKCERELPGECDGFLEFWNLVFNQFNQDIHGNLTPLEYTGIDTGMGFERLLMILQNRKSVYETDIFEPIIKKICKLSNLKYNDKNRVPINVIADHSRAVTFVLSEGVFPSNEGRGYVLRHILRRAIRYGKFIGFDSPFLYQVVDSVVESMGSAYPEITEKVEMVKSVIYAEEEAFFKTLNRGLEKLNEIIEETKNKKSNVISGDDVFMLYDSLGFPLDFTQQVAQDENLSIDMDRYNELMNEQKKRAKASWKLDDFDFSIISGIAKPTEYVGDELYECEGTIQLLIKNNTIVETVSENDDVIVIFNKTPFYAEKGGQVGDIGIIEKNNNKMIVNNTKFFENIHLHYARVLNGYFKANDKVILRVEKERKDSIARNHTATHLLHKALRTVIGEHATQAGSLVAPDRLRFDFTHHKQLTRNEIENIEDLVNKIILENIQLKISYMKKEDAIKSGAVAIFEEKYGDTVRIVEVPNFSKELCGGTHVKKTGDIGLFKIIDETSISAGTRRIEAITGKNFLEYFRKYFYLTNELCYKFNSDENNLLEKINNFIEDAKQKDRKIEELKKVISNYEVDNIIRSAKKYDDVLVVIEKVEMDNKMMLNIIDQFKLKAKKGIIFLISKTQDNKVNMIAGITKDLTNKIKAGDIVKEIAPIVGGGGGGRPDMAQAGGRNPEKIDDAIKKANDIIFNILKA